MLFRLIAAIISTLGKNLVPAAGFVARDWAPFKPMLLYLGENIVAVLLAALAFRMAVAEGKNRSDALRTFFLIAAPFTFGAALITSFIAFIRGVRIDQELMVGFVLMLFFQLVGFNVDLQRLRGATQEESEGMLTGVLGRVFLLAFAVWAGIFAVILLGNAFVLPFIVLKTIADLWRIRPDALKRKIMTSA